jgi:hypothetical protein
MGDVNMKKQEIKAGNVGALTYGVSGLWRVLAIDGQTLTLENIENKRRLCTMAANRWVLLDSFEP